MHLNSKRDYYNLLKTVAENVWRPVWEALNENRKIWMDMGEVEKGITDETHKWEEMQKEDPETKEMVTVIHQYELKEDPTHPFFRYHFRQEEIDKVLGTN